MGRGHRRADRVVALFVVDPVPLGTAGALPPATCCSPTSAPSTPPARRRRRAAGPLRPPGRGRGRRGGPHRRVVGARERRRVGLRPAPRRAVAAALAAGWRLPGTGGTSCIPPGGTVASTGRVQHVFTPFSRRGPPRPVTHGLMPGLRTSSTPPAGRRTRLPTPQGEPVMAGGEDAAHARLADWLDHVDRYDERRNTPGDDPGRPTSRRPAVRGRCRRATSPRRRRATPGRAAFVRQLAWRDWYAHLLPGARRWPATP